MSAFSGWLERMSLHLLRQWRMQSAGWSHCPYLRLRESFSLVGGGVRVPLEDLPIQIVLGGDECLHLHPETLLDAEREARDPPCVLILDPERPFTQISGFLRLSAGDRITLGRANAEQQALFGYPPGVEDDHLLVAHEGDAILFHNLPGARSCIAPLPNSATLDRLGKLRRLRYIFGGQVDPLQPAAALALIEQVNRLMAEECFRPRDDRGRPGGLITLPETLTPILVADLHGEVDNLLTVLSQNAFLEGIEAGSACLILMGDAVHSEVAGEMDAMDGSMRMMDLLFRLKLRFPERVFFLRGNHDSFAPDIAKGGVPQGLLWANALLEARGRPYLQAMEHFYDQLAYVACSARLIAVHAAPPRSRISPAMLVDIHHHPGLMRELTANRLQRPNRPQGYTPGDVRRFRTALGLDPDTPVVVGHTPMDRTDTLWLHAGGIRNHHVLFSANPDQVGVLTEIGGSLVPLRYRVELLGRMLNEVVLPLMRPPATSGASE